MTSEEKFEYWLELAQYDLDTAASMFTSGRWFYVVFMCQQAIEKLCKGLYTLYLSDNVPKIHDIKQIFLCFEEKLPVTASEDTYILFNSLSAYYLTSRYPDFNKRIQINKNEAELLLKKTKEVFTWLLTLKPSTE
ncbi:MAG: HEPN domain-containing protein [Treponema sp.]|nr:HEPN domain-containing protein [Treponema sp.]